MTFTAKADEMLKILDPIIGVAGKGADVTFNLTSEIIEVSITDESESALCRMAVNVSEGRSSGDLENYTVYDDISATVNIDTLVAALKMFGGRKVDISMSGRDVVIECDFGRRTLRTNQNVRTSRQVKFKSTIDVTADPADLKKAAAFDGISDSMYFDLHLGKLRIGCSSNNETAEIYIDATAYQDHRSYYSTELLTDIVRRIHSDTGAGVTIGLAEDAPLSLSFSYGCADFWIFVAPRINV